MTWRGMFVVMLLLVTIAVPSSSAGSRDSAQNQPGMPTIGQVRVVNATREEAVPIVFRGGGDPWPVSLTGAPTVALTPTAVVGTRATRQTWEYRQLTVSAGEDETALNAAGADGWEAIAALANASRTVWTLKRPR